MATNMNKRGRGRPAKSKPVLEPVLAETTEQPTIEQPATEQPTLEETNKTTTRKLITIDKLPNDAQYDIIYSYYYGKKIKLIAAQYDISTTTIYNIAKPGIAAGHFKRADIEGILKEAKIKSLEDKRDAIVNEYNEKIELLKAE